MSAASTGGTEGSSPASSPASAASQIMSAPKYGTLVPNRIFVGGISASTSEAELAELFSSYGNVKATKIISDRAGVSKGYGFVTFETEEEAKRLQQESECIILRERKLNIAPAIKKQTFNRSFDGGSGSPPAVPTSPYYYTNGMGLPYQNGLAFYNAGAPAPGTPLAPPTDPTTIYQAAGVFGPQAASAHQTFAPMMYPCPAPSLYMPQQYPYSPMPYETYYPGAGASPYLFTTSNATSNGNSGTTGGSSSGHGGTSSPSTAPHGLQSIPTPYYTASGPPTGAPHHHHSVSNGAPQLDQLYYGFAAAGPPLQHSQQQHPSSLHGPIGLGDQLLLYPTDASFQQQPTTSDSQTVQQDDTRSTSSNSEHQSQQHQQAQSTSNETHLSTTTTSLMPLMKYQIANRYHTNYHQLTLQSSHQQRRNHHHPPQVSSICSTETDDSNASNAMQCRTIVYHPLIIHNPYNSVAAGAGGGNNNNPTNPSLLPTPPSIDTYRLRESSNQSIKTSSFQSAIQNNTYGIIPKLNNSPKFPLKSNNISYNRKNSISSQCYMTKSSTNRAPIIVKTTRNDLELMNNRKHVNFETNTRRNTNTKMNLHEKNADSNSCEVGNNVDSKLTSPPPSPYSPMTHPLPLLSPPNPQVQFYTAHNRYQSQNHHQQQPQQQQRRYNSPVSSQIASSARRSTDKYNSAGSQGVVLRSNKFKLNGVIGSSAATASKSIEDSLGGAGDAQQTVVGRMPLTPPSTPRNLRDSNNINEACHQMQTLTL